MNESRATYRPLREELHMLTALTWALRSPCKRQRNGAVITDLMMKQVLSIGYNGPGQGLPHERCTGGTGTCGCLHAEDNAIARDQSPVPEKAIFCTTAPCVQCAQRILNTGTIRSVYFLRPYREPDGLEILRPESRTMLEQVMGWKMEIQVYQVSLTLHLAGELLMMANDVELFPTIQKQFPVILTDQ